MKKIIPLTLGVLLSTTSLSANVGYDKKFDCDPYEVKAYITQNTVNLSMPTSITKPTEFTEALIETKQEESAQSGEEEECLTIWTGEINFDEEWKELLEKLKDIDFDFDFSLFGGFDFNTILNKIGEKFDEAMDSVMEELDKGICERLGDLGISNLADSTVDYMNLKIDEHYNIDLASDSWFEDGLRRELNTEMRDLGTYVFDSDELKRDIEQETRRKVREVDDDFWNDL